MKSPKTLLAISFGLFALSCYAQDAIPEGTDIPVQLNSSMSAQNSAPGQTLAARVMQGVPLPNGARIPAGAKLIGRVVEVQPAAEGKPASVSFTFTNYMSASGVLTVRTSLRATASFVEVESARIPTTGIDDWGGRTTVQVGGTDVVYWGGGPVQNVTGPVGEPVIGSTDSVLVKLLATPGTSCNNESGSKRQALWVFSSDACGVYGMNGVTITKDGLADQTGVAELTLGGDTKIPRGTAMLLRVMSNGTPAAVDHRSDAIADPGH